MIRGGWPVRRMPMRNTLPAIHNASAALTNSKISVPTMSIHGGSAIVRFIMVNGVNSGIHESTRASVPFGSLGI